jgi:hypothetical protein
MKSAMAIFVEVSDMAKFHYFTRAFA